MNLLFLLYENSNRNKIIFNILTLMLNIKLVKPGVWCTIRKKLIGKKMKSGKEVKNTLLFPDCLELLRDGAYCCILPKQICDMD